MTTLANFLSAAYFSYFKISFKFLVRSASWKVWHSLVLIVASPGLLVSLCIYQDHLTVPHRPTISPRPCMSGEAEQRKEKIVFYKKLKCIMTTWRLPGWGGLALCEKKISFQGLTVTPLT